MTAQNFLFAAWIFFVLVLGYVCYYNLTRGPNRIFNFPHVAQFKHVNVRCTKCGELAPEIASGIDHQRESGHLVLFGEAAIQQAVNMTFDPLNIVMPEFDAKAGDEIEPCYCAEITRSCPRHDK
jgi:hypothetical protein